MANLLLPTGVEPIIRQISLERPGDVLEQSLFTQATQVIARNSARWRFRLEFGTYEFSNEDLALQVQGFLIGMSFLGNTFGLELPGIENPFTTATTVTAAVIRGGESQLTLNNPATAERMIKAGTWLGYSTQTMMAVEDQAANTIHVAPAVLDPVTTTPNNGINFRPTIQLRLDPNDPEVGLIQDADSWGPWTINCIEA